MKSLVDLAQKVEALTNVVNALVQKVQQLQAGQENVIDPGELKAIEDRVDASVAAATTALNQ